MPLLMGSFINKTEIHHGLAMAELFPGEWLLFWRVASKQFWLNLNKVKLNFECSSQDLFRYAVQQKLKLCHKIFVRRELIPQNELS